MKKQFQILFYFLFISFITHAQPSIAWQRCYGGTDNDFFLYAIKTTDGGSIATIASGSEDGDLEGITNSSGWVIKFDSLFNIEWQQFYSGDLYSSEPVQPICLANGDYIFGGYGGEGCNGFHGSTDLFLLKTNSSGDTLWSKCYGSPGSDQFSSILHTEDNGFLITGSSYYSGGDIPSHYGVLSTDIILIKTDSIGNILWLKVLGGSSYDSPLSAPIEITRGIYQIHLYSASDDYDLEDCPVTDIKKRWIVQLDSMGNIIKQNFLSAEDDLYSSDGAIFMEGNKTFVIGTGNAESANFPAPEGHAGDEGAIAVFDSTLSMINMIQFGGSGEDRFQRITKDEAGNYYIIGTSTSMDYDLSRNYNNGDNKDFWIVKLDSTFNLLWSRNFGGSEYDGDLGGGYFHGNLQVNDDKLLVFTGSITPENLPDYDIECGYLEFPPNFYHFQDAWLIAFDSLNNLPPPIIPPTSADCLMYPNPVNDILSVQSNLFNNNEVIIDLIDMAGKKILQTEKITDDLIQIDVKNILNGIYIVKIYDGNVVWNMDKIIIQH